MYRLGKLAPRRDPRTLRLASYLPPPLPSPPDAKVWSAGITGWGMMRNDEIGDCAIAGAGHAIYEWTKLARENCCRPSDDEIEGAYIAISGYDRRQTAKDGSNPTDTGCVLLDVLKRWRKLGIAGHFIDAFAEVHPARPVEVMTAVWLTGNLYIGLALPASADGQEVWTVTSGPDSEPGTWGGHCVLLTGYDAEGLTLITWGKTMRMSWAFFERYCDEAYALLSADWLSTATGMSPSQFNRAQLAADLARL